MGGMRRGYVGVAKVVRFTSSGFDACCDVHEVDGLHGDDGVPRDVGVDGVDGIHGDVGVDGDVGIDVGVDGVHGVHGVHGDVGVHGVDGIHVEGHRGDNAAERRGRRRSTRSTNAAVDAEIRLQHSL